MARMIPPYISNDVKSTGEKQIFNLFKNDPDTKDWIILHSLGLAKHVKRLYGEIDFLVLAQGVGIFCLEIKSGDIKREEGIWKFTNRFGKTTTTSRGPFQQAQEGMFSIMNAVKRKFGETNHQARLLYGYGVMFPHVLFKVEGVEYEWWQIYDRDLRRYPVSNYIKQLSKYTQKKVEHCKWFNKDESLPKKSDIDELAFFLRADFEKIVTPKQMLGDIEEGLNTYTEEQYKCLDQLQGNPRCLFQGGAGTGKTMIALETVRRGLFEKQRILLVCYNKLLGHWLASQFSSCELEKGLLASSFHSFLSRISCDSQDELQSFNDKEEFFKYDLPLLGLEAIDDGDIKTFDMIVIDEGQDLIRPEYLDVFDALLKGGLAGGNWMIFCDFERQAIYSDILSDEMVEMLEFRSNFTRFRLTVNCRNTRAIGVETSLLSGFETPPFLPSKFEGIPVEYYFYKDRDDQASGLEKTLLKLHDQKISNKNITVLSPIKYESSCLARINKGKFQINKLTGYLNLSDSFITFSTVHSFKGLENSYIILVDIDRINDDEFKSLLYIGMSRAKVGLFVFVNGQAKGDYNRIIKKRVLLNEKTTY